MSDVDDDEDLDAIKAVDEAKAAELIKEMAKLLKRYNARVGFVPHEGNWIDVGIVQGACDLFDVMYEMERMENAGEPHC